MRARSNTKPKDIIQCRGKAHINYNIKKASIVDSIDGKIRQVWEYDYVEVEGKATKEKMKEALRQEDIKKKDKGPWIPDEVAAEYKRKKDKLNILLAKKELL